MDEHHYSADVLLYIWRGVSRYAIRSVAPTFGRADKCQWLPPVGSECVVESIVDGISHKIDVVLTGITLEGETLKLTWEKAP